ncbi:pappalysin-1-like [Acropora millepora]|uniref:pappalysin-1-like n=1 Tax=Acropora millepora TaxID=45264 RepID=UPI001CF1D4DE|nr:pappalysin-1-like [Acropora millepora]XP_044175233.1 pappalysin-1-like [Acropora millepora]XP_044175240.1 pappalysin-1-like [Acropora millepora]XP_044175243.1 pappalysin-1-like [Acropora millepora]
MGAHSKSGFHLIFLGLMTLHLLLRVDAVLSSNAFSIEVKAAEEEEDKHRANCASTRRVKRHDHARFPSSPPTGTKFGKALRFFGNEVIRFSGAVKIPSHEFTLDFWMKPEGGQKSPVTVLGIFDDCSSDLKDGGWEVGLEETSSQRSLRVFFRLRTQRSPVETKLISPRGLEPNVWLHVAATYNGKSMKLYINQAKVAVSSEQSGHIFAEGFHVCEHFEAGGNRSSGVFFRGMIDEVRLWSIAKTHEEIRANVFAPTLDKERSLRLIESFSGKEELNRNPKTTWVPLRGQPEITKSTIPGDAHDLAILKPPCGETVCDNPEIIRSYVKNTELRGKKIVRYRVVNILEDNGTNPMVTKEQIQMQHVLLNQAFAPYNITFEKEEHELRNTSLRRRTVTYNCEASKIGDGVCNAEYCMHNITGNDGGDCDDKPLTRCESEKQNNGKCDPECNNYYNGWDYGDCCNKSITDVYKTCFDPTSPNRAYMSDREYKSLVNLDNRYFLNVYLAQWSNENLQGVATFPWEKSAHGIYGGTVLGLTNFGRKHHSNALVHEFGHVLGLWHVHHGVSELDCAHDCAETFPSLELGDLCSDTNPTPANNFCSDPRVGKDSLTCGIKKFLNTPFRNYMSYANDTCTESFTEQQAARMHCYVDLVYQSWQPEKTPPSFIPLPPRVTSKKENGVKLAWIPPLGTGGANALNGCHECREDRVFKQYAVSAESPIPDKPNGYWSTHQAVGAPDAEPCILSPQGWNSFSSTEHCPECYIELGFKEAVIPTGLSIWVVWNAKAGITNIQLIFEDGSEQSLGNATAQCGAPLTMALRVNKKVSKIRIEVGGSTEIDAVQLTSSVNHPNCINCQPVEYLVTREPPFSSGKRQRVRKTRFEDSSLQPGKTYSYTVQAVTGTGLIGQPSPPLLYFSDKGFCGDGVVDQSIGEECDDANVRDADGCNVQCKKEDVFHCTGHPSLCYQHDGDGKCEDFEEKTSIKDCGFYTPEGFEDQWAISVRVNPSNNQSECSGDVIIGPPARDLVCLGDSFNRQHAWGPCDVDRNGNFWLEVTFNRSVVPAAVVIYLGSDGKSAYMDLKEKTIKVELIDSSGKVLPSGGDETKLSCKSNPAVVPIFHDMTKPFFYVRKVRVRFRSLLVAVAGVALRSRASFDVVEMSKCRPDEIFSPRTQHCHKYMCERPSCEDLAVKHATVTCEGNEEGQTCSVTCKPGYRPFKTFKMICLNKKWQGINRACVPVSCGAPRIPHGIAECSQGHTFGKTCAIKCVPQAKMTGGEGHVKCEEDGRWSAQTSFCVMTCPNLVSSENSELWPRVESNCMNSKRTYLPGVSCKYRCKAGYRLKDQHDRRHFKMRCTKSGQWTRSSCERITCKEIAPNLQIWYNCSHGNAMGSVCSNHCPGETVHTVKCEENGQWSEPMKRCKSPLVGLCSVPKVPPGIVATCEDHYPGGICKAKCKEIGSDVIVAGNEDWWRVTLKCTPNLHWYPDPALLQCVPSCDRKYISDGWCDKINNNKHCRWDGGDCCRSTALNRIVRPVPSYCTTECECKDPGAIENKTEDNNPPDDEESDGSGSVEGQYKTST